MEIVNYKESVDPKMRATFDVYLGPVSSITYPNFRLKYGKNGGYYVARPSYLKGEDHLGNKTFGSYPEMSAEKWKSLSEKLMEMLKPLISKCEPPIPPSSSILEPDLPF